MFPGGTATFGQTGCTMPAPPGVRPPQMIRAFTAAYVDPSVAATEHEVFTFLLGEQITWIINMYYINLPHLGLQL